jgi:hypothetical protein
VRGRPGMLQSLEQENLSVIETATFDDALR